jgi:two-component system cell cycle response regulator DivK
MSKKVLIAEDYGDIRRMMKMLLEMYGYEALEASDGREAVEKAASCRPDLILMDIMMPEIDGIEATRAIRELDDLDDIPILAVTAHDDFYKDDALDAGFNDVLSKPLLFDELGPILEQYLHPPKAAVRDSGLCE